MTVGDLKRILATHNDSEKISYFDSEAGEDVTMTSSWVNFKEDINDSNKGNTVSEEVYTSEYIGRKSAEFELYKLQRNIDKMIAEIYSEHDKEIKDCGDNDCCLNCIKQYTDRLMKVVFKYCKENTDADNTSH